MIKEKTIQEIMDLPLVEVMQKYVPGLKKSGAQWMAKSPFTEEKTGSFSVSPAKNCWKCFSTGEGGNNGISFLMKSQHMSFTDAVRDIAGKFNITVEFDNDEQSQANVVKHEQQTKISDINAKALDFFTSNLDQLDPKEWRVDKETAEKFSIGYAPDEWKLLYQYLINKGITESQILAAELASRGKNNSVYDFFRNRIIFPIYDRRLRIVGFSGRAISPDDKAKYLNSRETLLFDKSTAFLGMNVARDQIVKTSSATLVEGNFDVTSMHKAGFANTVACCGTSVTRSHLSELKKLGVKDLLFVFDGDKAGRKALLKLIPMAIEQDFIVEAIVLPPGVDPDDFVNKGMSFKIELDKALDNEPVFVDAEQFEAERKEDFNYTEYKARFDFLNDYLPKMKQDAVELYAQHLFEEANTTTRKSKAESQLENFLALIKDHKLRKNYIKLFSKTFDFSATEAEKGIKAAIVTKNKKKEGDNEDSKWRFPSYLSKEARKEFELHGFYEDENPNKIGYWFGKQGYSFEQASNFLVKPLFHIISFYNNRRLVEIQNKHGKHIIEVPSKGFVSVAPFQEKCMEKGNFQLFGTAKQFKYISNKFLDKMPISHEIAVPGQQRSGFWAFANGIVENDTFKSVDDYGIVRASTDDTHYFLPAFSSIYKDFQDIDDPYESDRNFVAKFSDVDFKKWSTLFKSVHGDNGMFGISFLCAALFRDIIQSRSSYFPILYHFGDVQTGKSAAAKHVNSVLFGDQSPIMLNGVTHPALSRKMAQFRNAIQWADEYRNDIDEKNFQILKAVWDGAGRDKGKMTNDNKTTSSKIESALLMSGQYLPTRDSNALFTRMIICTFDIKAEDRTQEEIEQFAQLDELSKKGLTKIVLEIIKWRDYVKRNYEATFMDVYKEMRTILADKDLEYTGRVLQNYTVLLSVMNLLEDKLDFPFTYQEFQKVAVDMVVEQSAQINDSDVLNSYWKMIEFLFFNYEIEYGKDFAIREEVGVKRYVNKKKTEHLNFDNKKKVLYIQFGRIHPKYMEKHKQQNGTVGTNEGSIQSYMKSNKAFIGVSPAFSFDDKRTTAWMFDYEMLGITLEKIAPHEDPNSNINQKPKS